MEGVTESEWGVGLGEMGTNHTICAMPCLRHACNEIYIYRTCLLSLSSIIQGTGMERSPGGDNGGAEGRSTFAA